ncbi:MAG: rod shape-determining protein [Microgenomates group bacterium]
MINFIENIKKIKLPFLIDEVIGVDLGTSSTRIALREKGVVVREPTYLGYNTKIKDFIFFGKEAKIIIGKVPDYIKIIRPVINGIISDFDASVSLIRYYIQTSVMVFYKNFFLKPTFSIIAAAPHFSTEIEQKAIEELFSKLGFSQIYIIEKPIANALGAGIDVFSHQPALIVDMGAGLIEIAIVSGGGIVNSRTIKTAGESMNKIIYNYLYLKYGVIFGESTCENLKIQLLSFENDNKTITIKGKSLETGLPKEVKIKSTDIKESLITTFNHMVDNIRELIESSPPEILDEILSKGVILCGGLSRIKGIDKFFAKELRIPVYVNEFYEDTTIYGLLKLSKDFLSLSKLAIKF